MSGSFRIVARRVGNGSIVQFNLPAAMGRALPDGQHEFDAAFTDDGIALTYVGPALEDRKRMTAVEPPKWAQP